MQACGGGDPGSGEAEQQRSGPSRFGSPGISRNPGSNPSIEEDLQIQQMKPTREHIKAGIKDAKAAL